MYIIPFFCNNVSKLRAFGAMTTYNFFAQSLGDFSSDIKCANSVKPTSRVMVYEKNMVTLLLVLRFQLQASPQTLTVKGNNPLLSLNQEHLFSSLKI